MKKGETKLQRSEFKSEQEDSTSSEDDDEAELLTEELEQGFFQVLSQLKKKDPKLYEKNCRFFPAGNSDHVTLNQTKQKKSGRNQLEKDYKDWLKGKKGEVEDAAVKKNLKPLHDFWANPKLNKGENFLRDYILDKKYLDQDENFNVTQALKELEEEEKLFEEELLFEQKYNTRFENSDTNFGKKHPLTMGKAHGKKRKCDVMAGANVKLKKKAKRNINKGQDTEANLHNKKRSMKLVNVGGDMTRLIAIEMNQVKNKKDSQLVHNKYLPEIKQTSNTQEKNNIIKNKQIQAFEKKFQKNFARKKRRRRNKKSKQQVTKILENIKKSEELERKELKKELIETVKHIINSPMLDCKKVKQQLQGSLQKAVLGVNVKRKQRKPRHRALRKQMQQLQSQNVQTVQTDQTETYKIDQTVAI